MDTCEASKVIFPAALRLISFVLALKSNLSAFNAIALPFKLFGRIRILLPLGVILGNLIVWSVIKYIEAPGEADVLCSKLSQNHINSLSSFVIILSVFIMIVARDRLSLVLSDFIIFLVFCSIYLLIYLFLFNHIRKLSKNNF